MPDKIIIYQLLPRLYTNTCSTCVADGDIKANGVGKMNDITSERLAEIKSLGATHVWYTGVIEYATTENYEKHGITPCNPHVVKGKAGSPYAIRDYYDIDPNIAVNVEQRRDEWRQLVNRTHHAGLKVIMDFVPNHVAREYKSDCSPFGINDLGQGDDKGMFFSPNNNFYYITNQSFSPLIDLGSGNDLYTEFPARATGNDCFTASPGVNDWYETVKLNYGIDPWNGSRHFDPIPSTWHKMLHILDYWARMGVDGFRCDMAHMVPVEFWHWAISQIKSRYPHLIFIAEIYDVALYHEYVSHGLFDYLYNKVTLYDTLFNVLKYNQPANSITGCWQQLNYMGDHMLNFLENHDELRLASPQFCGNALVARPALVVSAALDRSPFLLYAGQELGERGTDAEGFSGQDGRTSIFDFWSVPSLRKWFTGKSSTSALELRNYYSRVLNLCNQEAAIAKGGMFDLMYVNPHLMHQYAFIRHCGTNVILIVANFSNEAITTCVNIPEHAFNHIGIKPGKYACSDLLHDKQRDAIISSNSPFTIEVEAYNAVMWKLQ